MLDALPARTFTHFFCCALSLVDLMPGRTQLDAVPIPGDLIINEIYYAPPASELEFVELFNRSDRSLDLCAVSFSDNRDASIALCTDVFELMPNELVVIARDAQALLQAFPEFDGPILSPGNWPALNNGGDTARILSGSVTIDEVAYTPAWGGGGVSLERKDPDGPSNAAFNWGSSTAPGGATPALRNSIFSPDRTPPVVLLAEADEDGTVTLFWNEPVREDILSVSMFTAGNEAPHAFVSISSTETRLSFGGIMADEIRYLDVADLTGNQAGVTTHPLAYLPGENDLVFNEILYAPLADPYDLLPDQPEYVELYNVSGRRLSLRHLALSGKPDERNEADTLRSSATFPVASPASYVLIHAVPQPEDGTSILRRAFPSIDFDADDVTVLPVGRASLGLSNTGDVVSISSEGRPVDALEYSPDWHHPLLVETRGIALERRSWDAPAHLPSNWSSAVSASGGTPGALNSIAADTRAAPASEMSIEPRVFSPNGDGVDDVLPIRFKSAHDSQVIDIKAFDIEGRLVRRVVESAIVGTSSVFFWDGYGHDGHLLPVGPYIITLEALDIRQGQVNFFKEPAILALPFD